MSNEREWTRTTDRLPLEGKTVETKIHDDKGERNVQPLKRRDGLWYFPDDSMYVYFYPTHWRQLEETK